MNYAHQIRRVKVQVELNVLPSQTPADVLDWVNKFFTYFHPNLEARVTQVEKFAPAPEVDGLALLGGPEDAIDPATLLDLEGLEVVSPLLSPSAKSKKSSAAIAVIEAEILALLDTDPVPGIDLLG